LRCSPWRSASLVIANSQGFQPSGALDSHSTVFNVEQIDGLPVHLYATAAAQIGARTGSLISRR
jgi:hypothetical protein